MNEAGSILVVDIGTVHTRALLFDVVDGRYHFLGTGSALSTLQAPLQDVRIGFNQAVMQVESVTGRKLLNEQGGLMLPADIYNQGVDTLAVTVSAGPLLKIALVGLIDELSLASLRHLAFSTYTGQNEVISLNDRRSPAEQIKLLAHMQPDLILIAGGIDSGAPRSLLSLLETIRLACSLFPEGDCPEILFCGNAALQNNVLTDFSGLTRVNFAPNIRPAVEFEQLEPARNQLADMAIRVNQRSLVGMKELHDLAKGNVLPTATAFGRIIQFLSRAHASEKGVLGVDVGAHATLIAAAWDGNLSLGVYPELGLNLVHALCKDGTAQSAGGIPNTRPVVDIPVNEILPWLSVQMPVNLIVDYLYNKALNPTCLPYSPEEMAIEQALTRVLLQRAIKKSLAGWGALPRRKFHLSRAPDSSLLPWFEPIIASGSVFSKAPNQGQALLMLLDGLQPTGASTLILDQQHLTSALGALAVDNPTFVVQVMDSSIYQHLGTVISPVGNARPGTPVMRIRMKYETGEETGLEILQGSLTQIPLPIGQRARLHLQPLHKYDVGMGGPGRSGSLGVIGGSLGVVVDARGRPIKLPADATRRLELMHKWLWTMGN